MSTGKIEYAPDYKSEKRHKFPVGPDGLTDQMRSHLRREGEHNRLRDAVVEAAKSLRQAILYPAADWPIEREMENFNRDVDALIEFESQEKKNEGNHRQD